MEQTQQVAQHEDAHPSTRPIDNRHLDENGQPMVAVEVVELQKPLNHFYAPTVPSTMFL